MKNSDDFDDMSFDDMTGSEKLMADMLALLMEHPDKFIVNEDGTVDCTDPEFFGLNEDDDDILAAEDDDSYE